MLLTVVTYDGSEGMIRLRHAWIVLLLALACGWLAYEATSVSNQSARSGREVGEGPLDRVARHRPVQARDAETNAVDAPLRELTFLSVIGAPAASVHVEVRRAGALEDERVVPLGGSTEGGEFELPRAPGQVFVHADGFVAERVQLTGAEERVDVRLRPGRACWIRVRDTAGNALANASLQVFSASPDGYEAREVRTVDAEGLVRLDLEARGDAVTSFVRASAPGVAPSELLSLPHWDQAQWTREAPHVIALGAGVEVRLRCIAKESGERVPDAVLQASDGQRVRLDDTTDGTLSFRLPDANSDAGYGWSGVVRAPGFGDTAVDLEVAAGVESVERDVELAGTWSRAFQVEADGGIPVGTRAIFRFGLEDATSGGLLGSQRVQRTLSVPAHGRVELRDAPAGVVPTLTDLIVVSPDFRVAHLPVGGPSRNVWTVQLGGEAEVHPDVRVLRADGSRLVGGRVSYRWLRDGDHNAVLVSERPIRGDRAEIPVPASRGEGRWLVTVWDGESLPVSIDTTGELPDVVRLERAVSIHGNVSDSNGAPARGAHVLVRWEADFRATLTGSDGRFRVRVPDRVPMAAVTVRHDGERWEQSLALPSGPLRIEWE